ncbi:MAG: hypothetical protein OEW09_10045 [Anaerolineae bacterium]|nr:hypothetical protein [Anaerolineae bacterium]
MAFNAKWKLEQLAEKIGKTMTQLLANLRLDLVEMVAGCPVFQLIITDNGNYFRLIDSKGFEHKPSRVAGLYSIFTQDCVIYFGEGKDLYRRQLLDPDNTADSGRVFQGQGRAILKLILHRGWASILDFDRIFLQMYPGDYQILRQGNRTFEDCYKVSEYRKALEGVLGLFVQQYHDQMVARARSDGLLK